MSEFLEVGASFGALLSSGLAVGSSHNSEDGHRNSDVVDAFWLEVGFDEFLCITTNKAQEIIDLVVFIIEVDRITVQLALNSVLPVLESRIMRTSEGGWVLNLLAVAELLSLWVTDIFVAWWCL